MAEPTPAGTPGPGNGPVEQEARHLVAAAARWLAAVPSPPQEYADSPDSREVPDGGGPDGGAPDGGARDGEAHGEACDSGAHARAGDGEAGPELCTGCPWCRAKAAAGPLGADALESLAHLLGAAAQSLQLFAESRREQAAQAEGAEGAQGAEADGADEAPEAAGHTPGDTAEKDPGQHDTADSDTHPEEAP